MGGMVRAIEKGFAQKEIQNAAYTYQRQIETKEQIVVGVNDFKLEKGVSQKLHKMGLGLEQKQARKLAALKKRRDAKKTAVALEKIRQAAKGSDNLMPHIVAAVRVHATVGEISAALKTVFGKYRETITI